MINDDEISRPVHRLFTPQMTNLGALDSIIHHSYPIPSGSCASPNPADARHMTIKHIEVHTIINHLPRPVLVIAYSWRGIMWYTYAISAAHMENNTGVEERGPATRAGEDNEFGGTRL